ncbi:hypothetical protein FLAG1_11459 [Fusarium langsethiae]|uniref:Chromo domain-containing protein n=1 Tax=Fusarium langsethiae TaxID=179993 RepID=A0A0N0DAU0_FUSLA|nr:hypothetical protein FLAG1_11459 [Fusarium langsethiae]
MVYICIPTIGDELHGKTNDAKVIIGDGKDADTSGSVVIIEKEITHLISHDVNKEEYTVSFKVSFKDGSKGLEEEEFVHGQAPGLLTKYWDSHGGRDAATKLDMYHVHKIHGHRAKMTKSNMKRRGRRRAGIDKSKLEYMIEWVGFPGKAEWTWEAAVKIKPLAQTAVNQYESSLGKEPEIT